uniref:Integrase zinc-binding domain-containing protein n=1 Tax=Mycena chlorophos TaxID=658473 RepID=A0ABQ0L162_MYCCL|nr:predicted protein [Mycena chlorophos]
MILSGHKADLAAFLLWFQTFPTSPDLTFSVVEFDPKAESWVVMTIGGDAVENTNAAMEHVLGEIKKKLWANDAFANFVDATLARKGVAGPKMKRVVEATSTFTVVYIETDDQNGHRSPLYQFLAQPISDDAETHRVWVGHIRKIAAKVIVGMHALEIEKWFVDCVHCKSKIHPGHGCVQPKTAGWLGPIPKDKERHEEHVAKGGNDRDNRQGREKDSRGPQRRDRDDRQGGGGRGWSQVPYRKTGGCYSK